MSGPARRKERITGAKPIPAFCRFEPAEDFLCDFDKIDDRSDVGIWRV